MKYACDMAIITKKAIDDRKIARFKKTNEKLIELEKMIEDSAKEGNASIRVDIGKEVDVEKITHLLTECGYEVHTVSKTKTKFIISWVNAYLGLRKEEES